jgi:hypothetical protein
VNIGDRCSGYAFGTAPFLFPPAPRVRNATILLRHISHDLTSVRRKLYLGVPPMVLFAQVAAVRE